MRIFYTKTLLFLSLLTSMLMLSGCRIDGEESLELKSDGSATVSINYVIPNRAFSKQECETVISFLQGVADRHDSITLTKGEVLPSGRLARRLMIDLKADDVMKIKEILDNEIDDSELDPDSGSEIAGKIYAIIGDISADIEGTSIKYRREVNLNSLLLRARVRNADLLGNSKFRYSLTVPDAPTSHNATSTSNNGRTLTWVLPLREYYDKPFIMEATIPAMSFIPWWIWVAVGVVVLLILILGYYLCRKLFKKKA